MKLFRNKSSKLTFLTVEIDGKFYDYPKDFPIPHIGEKITINGSNMAMVKGVLYQVSEADKDNFNMIIITTETY